jgi:HemY protein
VADGRVFPRWAPVSPVSGRVGAFEWKVIEQPPLREALEIEAPAPAAKPAMGEPERPAPQAPQVEALPSPAAKREAAEPSSPAAVPPRETTGEAPRPAAPPAPVARPVAPLPPVLPPAERTPGLILAPDDPGTGDDEPAEGKFRAF